MKLRLKDLKRHFLIRRRKYLEECQEDGEEECGVSIKEKNILMIQTKMKNKNMSNIEEKKKICIKGAKCLRKVSSRIMVLLQWVHIYLNK